MNNITGVCQCLRQSRWRAHLLALALYQKAKTLRIEEPAFQICPVLYAEVSNPICHRCGLHQLG